MRRTDRWIRGLGIALALVAVAFIVGALVVFYHGAVKAHIIRGVGLDPHWSRARPADLMIFAGALGAVGFMALLTLRQILADHQRLFERLRHAFVARGSHLRQPR